MTVDNYHWANATSKTYALEKVDEYKRFNDRYQNWKEETKKEVADWKERQIKAVTGKNGKEGK
jgi:hypothetical protein